MARQGEAKLRIGIDLGGTKIAIIALDEAGRKIERRRMETPQGDYRGTLEAIGSLVDRVEKELGLKGTVGIGTPGVTSSSTGVLKNSNSVCLIGRPFQHDLEEVLGRPVRMANDANCFALSEATDGAGAGCSVVFGVILGTGVGGGIVVDGRVLTGANAIAGEWGHNPLPWPGDDERPGPQCYCGRRGCIETFLSGPGMKRDHHAATGRMLEPPTIVARAKKGDKECRATLRRYEHRLARALAHVINILDPDVIVLGGGMSNIRGLCSAVPQLWGEYVFSDRVDTRLVPARYGDSSGVRGAAWLWGTTPVDTA
jgi:fructokinase